LLRLWLDSVDTDKKAFSSKNCRLHFRIRDDIVFSVKFTQPFTPTTMSNSYPTDAGSLEPQADFTSTPSVSQAAHDLRVAAGEKIKDLAHQAGAIKDKALESASHFRETAAESASAFKASAVEKAAHFREVAQEQWTDTREKAREVHISTEAYIREHPTKCVLGALGIGFLIGLIARR
jgi:ElaB/YqjD/DUF883 family membrane-anchored ribosome-binding protein